MVPDPVSEVEEYVRHLFTTLPFCWMALTAEFTLFFTVLLKQSRERELPEQLEKVTRTMGEECLKQRSTLKEISSNVPLL